MPKSLLSVAVQETASVLGPEANLFDVMLQVEQVPGLQCIFDV